MKRNKFLEEIRKDINPEVKQKVRKQADETIRQEEARYVLIDKKEQQKYYYTNIAFNLAFVTVFLKGIVLGIILGIFLF